MTTTSSHDNHPSGRSRYWGGFIAFLSVAAFFPWTEHRAHLLGVLPYLILLLCPLIHMFTHGGHGNHGGHHES